MFEFQLMFDFYLGFVKPNSDYCQTILEIQVRVRSLLEFEFNSAQIVVKQYSNYFQCQPGTWVICFPLVPSRAAHFLSSLDQSQRISRTAQQLPIASPTVPVAFIYLTPYCDVAMAATRAGLRERRSSQLALPRAQAHLGARIFRSQRRVSISRFAPPSRRTPAGRSAQPPFLDLARTPRARWSLRLQP